VSTLVVFRFVAFGFMYGMSVMVVVIRGIVTIKVPEISRINVVTYFSELFVEGKV